MPKTFGTGANEISLEAHGKYVYITIDSDNTIALRLDEALAMAVHIYGRVQSAVGAEAMAAMLQEIK